MICIAPRKKKAKPKSSSLQLPAESQQKPANHGPVSITGLRIRERFWRGQFRLPSEPPKEAPIDPLVASAPDLANPPFDNDYVEDLDAFLDNEDTVASVLSAPPRSETWAGKDPDGTRLARLKRVDSFPLAAALAVQRQTSIESTASATSEGFHQSLSCRSLGSNSFPSPLRVRSGSKSWREFANRSFGKDGYRFGDLSRGVAHAIVTSIIGGADDELRLEDLEPATRNGEICEQRRSPSKLLGGRKPTLALGFTHGLGIPPESILGEGQYGIVWRAIDIRNKQMYAVKCIKATLKKAQAETQAEREVEVATFVRDEPHPCLVQLFGVFQSKERDGVRSLVMELCLDGDLQCLLSDVRKAAAESHQPYSAPELACRWLAQIFLGLEHVHLQIEMLFRDLKPGNIVFDSHRNAKITDFGLCRCGIESSGAWSFGFPAGSPGYIAPEIVENQKYDYRADLYSFGVLIWVLLTGGVTDRDEPMPPMDGINEEWTLLQQCLDDPASNSALPLEDAALDIVRSLTDRSPEERLQHSDIREHSFFQSQALPPSIGRLANAKPQPSTTRAADLQTRDFSTSPDAARQAVMEWLECSNRPVTNTGDDRIAGDGDSSF